MSDFTDELDLRYIDGHVDKGFEMKHKAPVCRNCNKKTHKDYYIELAEGYLLCRECIRIAGLALMKKEMDEMK